ncbi:hypothetical protein OPV22_004944 [Ensete ventricosum]|uniref:Uncharacterized protein n=1 Tax=Ensete ventricosum TaxID=4639 RepID=A0AAV8RQ06_ENSVE|nr:hypothetical protein OPV22_004944 [Ensete ventricosum]
MEELMVKMPANCCNIHSSDKLDQAICSIFGFPKGYDGAIVPLAYQQSAVMTRFRHFFLLVFRLRSVCKWLGSTGGAAAAVYVGIACGVRDLRLHGIVFFEGSWLFVTIFC